MSEVAEPEPGGPDSMMLTSSSTQRSPVVSKDTDEEILATRRLTLGLEANKEFQDLVSYYNSANCATRTAIVRQARYIVDYPEIHMRTSQSSRMSGPFRLMDLPPEVRLLIAEYALADNEPLGWYWVNYQDGKRVGGFDSWNEVTSLAQVCNQIHSEISSLVWEVNTFSFSSYNFGEEYDSITERYGTYRDHQYRYFHDVHDACYYFLQRLPSTSLKHVQWIEWMVNLPDSAQSTSRCFQDLANLSGLYPAIHVKVQVWGWSVDQRRRQGKWTACLEDVVAFMTKGREFQDILSSSNLDDANRKWRICAYNPRNAKNLRDHLKGSELQTALSWFTDGI